MKKVLILFVLVLSLIVAAGFVYAVCYGATNSGACSTYHYTGEYTYDEALNIKNACDNLCDIEAQKRCVGGAPELQPNGKFKVSCNATGETCAGDPCGTTTTSSTTTTTLPDCVEQGGTCYIGDTCTGYTVGILGQCPLGKVCCVVECEHAAPSTYNPSCENECISPRVSIPEGDPYCQIVKDEQVCCGDVPTTTTTTTTSSTTTTTAPGQCGQEGGTCMPECTGDLGVISVSGCYPQVCCVKKCHLVGGYCTQPENGACPSYRPIFVSEGQAWCKYNAQGTKCCKGLPPQPTTTTPPTPEFSGSNIAGIIIILVVIAAAFLLIKKKKQ